MIIIIIIIIYFYSSFPNAQMCFTVSNYHNLSLNKNLKSKNMLAEKDRS